MFSDTDLVNPLKGPGTLYVNLDTLQAPYSTSISLNQDLDSVIADLTTETTSTPSSSTPDQTNTSVTLVKQPSTLPPGMLSTTLPPATANLATSISPTSMIVTTEDPIDECDDDSTSSNSIGTSKSRCDEDSSRKKT